MPFQLARSYGTIKTGSPMPQASFLPGCSWMDSTGAPVNAKTSHEFIEGAHDRKVWVLAGALTGVTASVSLAGLFIRWEDEWSL